MSYLIAAISNSGGAPEQAYRKLQSAGACPERPYAEMFKFEVPSLTVGTLDTLMNLSDEMGKTDAIVESIVRKIEKTAQELSMSIQSSSSGSYHSSSSSSGKVELSVGGVPSSRYIQQFAWDSAKYPNRRPLKELVNLISGGACAVEEEMKQLSQSYGERVGSLQELSRRKKGNLITVDLNDVLTEDIMSKVKCLNTDYLKTVFIAVPKAFASNFEPTIYGVGKNIVGYGGPDWVRDPTKLGEPVSFGIHVDRHKTRGSPVVPGSVQKVHSDDESVLYSVTILRGQYEAGFYDHDEFHPGSMIDFEQEFAKACRDHRYTVRPLEWDPTQASKASMALEQLQVEVDGMKSALMRWCKNHYGDAFVAWMHIKVIRVFVESVLRYGLPVDFTAVLYKVQKGRSDAELIKSLDKHLSHPSSHANALIASQQDDEDGDDEFHDFVLIKFDP